jgi:hypothetical protein
MLLDDLSDTASGPSPRHRTVQVRVGDGACAVLVGGGAPIVVQSMTNTDTADIDGTVQQVAALARAGSELVRITVDRDEAAAAVPHIRDRLAKLGVGVPLAVCEGETEADCEMLGVAEALSPADSEAVGEADTVPLLLCDAALTDATARRCAESVSAVPHRRVHC